MTDTYMPDLLKNVERMTDLDCQMIVALSANLPNHLVTVGWTAEESKRLAKIYKGAHNGDFITKHQLADELESFDVESTRLDIAPWTALWFSHLCFMVYHGRATDILGHTKTACGYRQGDWEHDPFKDADQTMLYVTARNGLNVYGINTPDPLDDFVANARYAFTAKSHAYRKAQTSALWNVLMSAVIERELGWDIVEQSSWLSAFRSEVSDPTPCDQLIIKGVKFYLAMFGKYGMSIHALFEQNRHRMQKSVGSSQERLGTSDL